MGHTKEKKRNIKAFGHLCTRELKVAFGAEEAVFLLFNLFFLLFSLFLLLFICFIALFGIIYEFHCTISVIFNFIYNTFSKKNLVSTK